MKFLTYFSKQARKPSGIFGRVFMSKIFDKGNLELNNLSQESLAIQKSDSILEIGCGTGLLINNIGDRLKNGIVEGVDFSKTMIAIAKKKNKKTIKN